MRWWLWFECIKCKNNKYSKGKKVFNKRCSRCGYDESPTANTLFHKVKFEISEAYDVVYDMSKIKKGSNNIWLAGRHGIKQITAWLIRHKIQESMKSSENIH